ncbi:hypothetical protein [Desulfurobacterium sp.]
MKRFSCYVDVERFLGEPVKELAQFLCCLRRGKRFEVILSVAEFLKKVNKTGDFYQFKNSGEKTKFMEKLPLSDEEKKVLWKLISRFFLKHCENSSGIEIPQNDLISLRKGRLFEEIIYRIGPARKWKVDLVSMHCQPMLNGKKVEIKCRERTISGKNLDVVFWGKHYIEGYECKSNVAFFIQLGTGHNERARKIRDKIRYLNQLAAFLKKNFREVEITLASFAPDRNYEKFIPVIKEWISQCGDERLHFKIKTIEDILKEVE